MSDLWFDQLFDPESCSYTYLVGDRSAQVAVLVDPVLEQVDRDLARLREHGLRLLFTLETHIHADHVTAGNLLAERLDSRPVVSERSAVSCDAVRVRHGDVIQVGGLRLEVLETPGHTPESVSYLLRGVGEPGGEAKVMTGDALLIGTCGRTDFQGGDAGALFDSVQRNLFSLDDATVVYPGHDYRGKRASTIGEERRGNERLSNRTREEFIALMSSLDLPRPRRMDEALPRNLACGKPPSLRQG